MAFVAVVFRYHAKRPGLARAFRRQLQVRFPQDAGCQHFAQSGTEQQTQRGTPIRVVLEAEATGDLNGPFEERDDTRVIDPDAPGDTLFRRHLDNEASAARLNLGERCTHIHDRAVLGCRHLKLAAGFILACNAALTHLLGQVLQALDGVGRKEVEPRKADGIRAGADEGPGAGPLSRFAASAGRLSLARIQAVAVLSFRNIVLSIFKHWRERWTVFLARKF
jgi:hypothetical protein